MKSKDKKTLHSKPGPADAPFFSKKKMKHQSLGEARKKALKKLQQAHQYLNGTSPLESRMKKSRGLELAKKLLSPAIQKIETISAVLQNMIPILSDDNNFDMAIQETKKSKESDQDASIYLNKSFFDKDQDAQVKQLIQEAANKTRADDWGRQEWSKVYNNDRPGEDFQMPDAWANYIYCLLNMPKDKSEIIIETIPGWHLEEEEEEEEGGEEENNEDGEDDVNSGSSSLRSETDSTDNPPASEDSPSRNFLDRLSDFFNL